jgi:hypothetical protein
VTCRHLAYPSAQLTTTPSTQAETFGHHVVRFRDHAITTAQHRFSCSAANTHRMSPTLTIKGNESGTACIPESGTSGMCYITTLPCQLDHNFPVNDPWNDLPPQSHAPHPLLPSLYLLHLHHHVRAHAQVPTSSIVVSQRHHGVFAPPPCSGI